MLAATPSTGTYQIDQSNFTATQRQTGADDKPVVVLYIIKGLGIEHWFLKA
jgi:hypothetical protein